MLFCFNLSLSDQINQNILGIYYQIAVKIIMLTGSAHLYGSNNFKI